MAKSNIKPIIQLQLLFLLYSLTSVLSKYAGTFAFLSFQFIVIYGAVLLLLFSYAIFWQQLLKKIPLSVAYSNKGVVLFWGMLFGWLFWNEEINPLKFFSIIIVFVGIYLVVISNE